MTERTMWPTLKWLLIALLAATAVLLVVRWDVHRATRPSDSGSEVEPASTSPPQP